MYLLDVRDILQRAGRKVSESGTIELSIEDDYFEIKEPVEFELTATNLEELILVEGLVKATVTVCCSRCNKPFQLFVESELEADYYEEGRLFAFNSKDREIGKEDLLFTVNAKGSIDLEEAIRQTVVSALPLDFSCKNCDKKVYYSI